MIVYGSIVKVYQPLTSGKAEAQFSVHGNDALETIVIPITNKDITNGKRLQCEAISWILTHIHFIALHVSNCNDYDASNR